MYDFLKVILQNYLKLYGLLPHTKYFVSLYHDNGVNRKVLYNTVFHYFSYWEIC